MVCARHGRDRRLLVILAAGALFLTGAAKAEAPKAEGAKTVVALSPDQVAAVKTATSVTAFRIAAIGDADAAAQRIMTKGAYLRWKELTDKLPAEMRGMCLTDFFNTAVVLLGPQKPAGGISMLYSPFQDVALLMQTENFDEFCLVEDFRFMPGKVFRNEAIAPDVPPETLMPKEIPLTVALMKAFAATEKRFAEICGAAYPLQRYDRLSDAGFAYLKNTMIARNVCALSLLEDKFAASLNAMTEIQEFLRHKSTAELKKRVGPGVFQEQAESFGQIPPAMREGITLCHFLASPQRNMFAFANKYFPRFLFLVSADPAKPESPWTLEWFDLNKSSYLYGLYAKKQPAGNKE